MPLRFAITLLALNNWIVCGGVYYATVSHDVMNTTACQHQRQQQHQHYHLQFFFFPVFNRYFSTWCHRLINALQARTHIHMHTHFQLPKCVLFSSTSTNMTNKSPDFLNQTVLLPVHLVVVAVLPLCLLKCFWCLLLGIKHTERPMFIYITSFLHAFHIADLAGPTWWSHDVWPYFSVKYFAKNIHGKMLPQLN